MTENEYYALRNYTQLLMALRVLRDVKPIKNSFPLSEKEWNEVKDLLLGIEEKLYEQHSELLARDSVARVDVRFCF
ncbi:MAG: hypothetical protein GWO16_07620 [Gammaproteobacteria bacterium]|nr:hypothetical protein [Gammaproteobacteria bacterium]NIR97826.1 hypothetical protein [Gammaproteobacteria bacterium]NIT63526.1 hypothetical protein [Gammaproteobacteria bacterium]NIV20473.1 hypothetical protein [Gammaproteobacteria bacterium]NIX11055.1 hypothetical protein [Gammaproteobacteria bacterium]